jgi:predicted RecB family nuclease
MEPATRGVITQEVLESFVMCKYKAYLKLLGEHESASPHKGMAKKIRVGSREGITDKAPNVRKNGEPDQTLLPAKSPGMSSHLISQIYTDQIFSVEFNLADAGEDNFSSISNYRAPVIFCESLKVLAHHRLLLTLYSLLLLRFQGMSPRTGYVWHFPQGTKSRVGLRAHLQAATRTLKELLEVQAGEVTPPLFLNNHCQICGYQKQCRARAEKEDNLSLLRGISQREIARLNSHGIFTVTQLSYTFRIRRHSKRSRVVTRPHSFPLQALAIREKTVFIYEALKCSSGRSDIHFDIEGIPGSAYYLIGVISNRNDVYVYNAFWSDDNEGEIAAFTRFLDFVELQGDVNLFHYGAYDCRALRSIRSRLLPGYQDKLDAALGRCINLLELIRGRVYFPTFSNSLKDIGKILGQCWPRGVDSALHTIYLRESWQLSRAKDTKLKLLAYNRADCEALRKLVSFVGRCSSEGTEQNSVTGEPIRIKRTDDADALPRRKHRFGRAEFVLAEFSETNKLAYFDYQRESVISRKNRVVRKSTKKVRAYRLYNRVSKVVKLKSQKCPSCRSKHIKSVGKLSRRVVDLKFSGRLVKRWVVRYHSEKYVCNKCNFSFVCDGYPEGRTVYGPGIIGWCVYSSVACGHNISQVGRSLQDLFGVRVPQPTLYRCKGVAAQRYWLNYENIKRRILSGKFLHIDETEVTLKDRKGYVWVIANDECTYYFFRENREAGFLQEFLGDFSGVLVSDFFAGYDSVNVPQQRCLIHLLRDLNDDLRCFPFDGQLREVATRFASVLRGSVAIIDRHGLSQRHLGKHKEAAASFSEWLHCQNFDSDPALKYQKRFSKYSGRIFTFMEHDGITWNNNCAENAMKVFARQRRFADGRFTEASISDYLVLLSLYQTCERTGVSFLGMLLDSRRAPLGHIA